MLQFKSKFILLISLFFSLTLGLPRSIHAGQPVIWEINGRAELLKGDARGVSITDTGVLMLAPNLTEVFNTSGNRTRWKDLSRNC